MKNENNENYDTGIDLDEVDFDEIECATTNNRKKRTSAIPADYDPTPNYERLPEGYIRPQATTWSGSSLAAPLSIGDLNHLWSIPVDDMAEAKRKHRFLASKVVMVSGNFWVKDRKSGLWLERKNNTEVKSVLMADWGREKTKFNIRKETIADFLKSSEFVVLEATAYLPGAGDFVEIRGRKYLNLYHERPMPYRDGATESDAFSALLEMVVFNLMGRDHGSFDEWMDEIFGEEDTDLKWLIHWLASQYQRPGKALPTALWLVGRGQGVGKGLFTSGLALLIGRSNAKKVSPEEFGGGWTDFLIGASLIELDEIDFGSRKEAYDKIKRLIGNEMTAARKRNHGDIILPSVANFVFTTNNPTPIAMDQGDRRNTVFGTKNTVEAKARARAFFQLGENAHKQAWEGMAELLANIEIDDVLISNAFPTDIKERMIETNINPVEEWLMAEETLQVWPVLTFAPSDWLYGEYADWMRNNDGFTGCINRKYFFRQMGEMNDLGLVSRPERKTHHGDVKYRGFIRYDPEMPCSNIAVAEVDFIPTFQKSGKLIDLRDRIKSQTAQGW